MFCNTASVETVQIKDSGDRLIRAVHFEMNPAKVTFKADMLHSKSKVDSIDREEINGVLASAEDRRVVLNVVCGDVVCHSCGDVVFDIEGANKGIEDRLLFER